MDVLLIIVSFYQYFIILQYITVVLHTCALSSLMTIIHNWLCSHSCEKHLLASSCLSPSVHPHVSAELLLDSVLRNLILGSFMRSVNKLQTWVDPKILDTLHEVQSPIKSLKCSVRVEWHQAVRIAREVQIF